MGQAALSAKFTAGLLSVILKPRTAVKLGDQFPISTQIKTGQQIVGCFSGESGRGDSEIAPKDSCHL